MEIKKTPKADLEGKKSLFLLIGYVVALSVLFVAFEWGTRDIKKVEIERVADVIAEEEIEITRQENTPPPPPPPGRGGQGQNAPLCRDKACLVSTRPCRGKVQTHRFEGVSK